MSTIKKAFQPIMTVLATALSNGEVSQSLHDEVEALTVAKVGAGGGKATTFHKNEDGAVVAIKCYFHKLWMDPRVADFGAKVSSATGLNSMCKDGVSKWTKNKSEAKKAEANILTLLTNGDITAEDIPAEQARIADEAAVIVPREDDYGFASLEECLADSEARGL
jgi:hypothetical protein